MADSEISFGMVFMYELSTKVAKPIWKATWIKITPSGESYKNLRSPTRSPIAKYILKTGMNTSWAGSRFPAVKSNNIAMLNLNEYLVTTKAISDPNSKIRNTAGMVIRAVLAKYLGKSMRSIALV